MLNPQFTIEWCNFSSRPDDLLLTAFHEFDHQLSRNYPQLPPVKFSKLPDEHIETLPEYLVAMLPGRFDDGSFADFEFKRTFVFCNEQEDFVRAYQQENHLAHWGVAIPCTLAIAWEPSKYLFWHELLHLLNAKDCYNKFAINKCPNAHCIMRRAPSEANCGDQLTLCSKNVERIRRHAAEALVTTELRQARADESRSSVPRE